MTEYRITLTEDTLRVIGNACENVALSRTRDSLIARQVAGVIKHALIPDTTPLPMRWADEPLPKCEVKEAG